MNFKDVTYALAKLNAELKFKIVNGECNILAQAIGPDGETYSITGIIKEDDTEKKALSIIRWLMRSLDFTFNPHKAHVMDVPEEWDSMSLNERGDEINTLTKRKH